MALIDPAMYVSKNGGVPKGWTNKAIREARDQVRANGKIPILLETSFAIRSMVDAAIAAWEANTDLKGYTLEGGKNEWSIIWAEGNTDMQDRMLSTIWCRCKPDHLSADRKLIVDAKFTDTSANPDAFTRQIDRMAYDSRGAFYLRGNAATGGAEDAKYVYLVQEQKPPYASAFIGLSPAYVELGNAKVREAINIWRDCMASGKWPGYSNRIHWAEPPSWAIAQHEEREAYRPAGDPYEKLFGKDKIGMDHERDAL
jgi:PDDEXK-like domain of unknown function (DUF3799)